MRWLLVPGILSLWSMISGAAEPTAGQYLEFIRAQAASLRAGETPPKSAEEWAARRRMIRERLEDAWGGFPAERGPLEVRKLAELQRDGYRIEKLLLQTLPDAWMTALAYVPDSPGKHPAILSVHGHWQGAKVEPTIQSRAIGAAKLGFFVLAVDAFGAGERGIGKQLGEYHGEMVAATLFPVGKPLSGIQVYENMRCVDYLQSRPEVDPGKIGITGASGGGNQTMYAGAWDERFGAVVPVCSVGNYQAYLGPACCMCEVVPGALKFTEEYGVLGLTAPRALMPCNVTRDGPQFSIREARKSVVAAQEIYDVLQAPNNLYHSTFRWQHDYHQPIREAMYGWMTQHLKGEGDGSPIAEPAHQTEDPEQLRLFPHDSRPDDWLTLPQFAARQGRQLMEQRIAALNGAQFDPARLRQTLVNDVFGGFPEPTAPEMQQIPATPQSAARIQFTSEPGITLAIEATDASVANIAPAAEVVLLLNLDGAAAARQSQLARSLTDAGLQVLVLDLRATGKLTLPQYRVGRAPDHHPAEWGLWIGRPLLGQWTWDVLRAIEVIKAAASPAGGCRIRVIGDGPAGLVALCAAACSDQIGTAGQIDTVAAVNSLTSYISDTPYTGQYLGLMAPGILRDVGDVPQLAALSQAKRTLIAGGVNGGGQSLAMEQLKARFTDTHLKPVGGKMTAVAADPATITSLLLEN